VLACVEERRLDWVCSDCEAVSRSEGKSCGMRVAAYVVVGEEDSKWCGERLQKYERYRGRSCGVRAAACVVVSEEDSRWCGVEVTEARRLEVVFVVC
jgi:hypothetical protein